MKQLSKVEQQAVGGGDPLQDLIDEAARIAREIYEELKRQLPDIFPNRNN